MKYVRTLVPAAKDQLWYGDIITYIFTMTGWAYLATVIDGYSRKVVGWAVADHMREELVTGALPMALANRNPGIGEVVFHSRTSVRDADGLLDRLGLIDCAKHVVGDVGA